MRLKTINEVSEFIAEELCRRVGARFPCIDGMKYKTDDYTWTREEEDEFRKWIISYLSTLSMFKRLGKKRIRKEADWIIFQYSWKIKEEK